MFLDIDDPDQSIYRITPLWFFEAIIRLRHIVLVPPAKWEDPFEQLPERCLVTDTSTRPYSQKPIGSLLRPAYGQCWSRVQRSDTLWRSYSRVIHDVHSDRNRCLGEEGVQLVSTSRKLLGALAAWSPFDASQSCFIGSVRYTAENVINQHLGSLVSKGIEHFAVGRNRAELLLVKRPAFQHEAEVRLVYVEHRDVPHMNHIQVPVEPNALFDEVSFDPRLAPFERREREQRARDLGYTGPFGADDLYEPCLLEIVLAESSREGDSETGKEEGR